MKRCADCLTEKPLTEFGRERKWRRTPLEEVPDEGFYERCRVCVKKAGARRYYQANPEKVRAQVDQWRADNPEARKRTARNYARKVRWGKFGCTPEQAELLLQRSQGRCEGCGDDLDGVVAICVDHDHDTNLVRGILCAPCNRAAGMLRDDPARLRGLADYLEFHGR